MEGGKKVRETGERRMESSAARLFEKEKRMEALGFDGRRMARTNFALLPPSAWYPLHFPWIWRETGYAYVARGFGSYSVLCARTRTLEPSFIHGKCAADVYTAVRGGVHRWWYPFPESSLRNGDSAVSTQSISFGDFTGPGISRRLERGMSSYFVLCGSRAVFRGCAAVFDFKWSKTNDVVGVCLYPLPPRGKAARLWRRACFLLFLVFSLSISIFFLIEKYL